MKPARVYGIDRPRRQDWWPIFQTLGFPRVEFRLPLRKVRWEEKFSVSCAKDHRSVVFFFLPGTRKKKNNTRLLVLLRRAGHDIMIVVFKIISRKIITVSLNINLIRNSVKKKKFIPTSWFWSFLRLYYFDCIRPFIMTYDWATKLTWDQRLENKNWSIRGLSLRVFKPLCERFFLFK